MSLLFEPLFHRYEEYLESIVKRSVGLKEEDDSDLLLGIHFQVILHFQVNPPRLV